MAEPGAKADKAELELQSTLERCKDKKALDAFIRARTLHGIVRLGFEIQTAKPGKEFLDVMKLWERVLMSIPTKPKGKGKRAAAEAEE